MISKKSLIILSLIAFMLSACASTPPVTESGTPNGVGIAGLGAGINWLKECGLDELRAHEVELTRHLREGLGNIKGVRLYSADNPELSTAVVSFTLEGRRVSEVGYRLDKEFEILCRVGLHCAPAVHRSIGSFPEGTVRLVLRATTTLKEIESTVRAVERIAAS